MITRVESKEHFDHRGSLVKSLNSGQSYKEFLQAKDGYVATSFKNIMRGLHMQSGAYAQAKIFTVIKGKIILYAVESEQLLERTPIAHAIELSDESPKKRACLVSRYAYTGYLTLRQENIVTCIADNEYRPDHEKCISPKSLILASPEIDFKTIIASDKDLAAAIYNISAITKHE